jgi:hypothetical protein
MEEHSLGQRSYISRHRSEGSTPFAKSSSSRFGQNGGASSSDRIAGEMEMKILSKKSGWIIHPLEGGLGTYKETWDKLNSELYASNPYFDSNFIEPMLTYFTTGEEKLCIHRQGDDIDGLVIVSPSGLAKWSINGLYLCHVKHKLPPYYYVILKICKIFSSLCLVFR